MKSIFCAFFIYLYIYSWREEHEEHLPNFGSVDTRLTVRNGVDGEGADFGNLNEIVSLDDTGGWKLQPII